MGDPVFATLGPSGSNHDLVLNDYKTCNQIAGEVRLCPDFDEVLQICATGEADHILICAAHGSCAKVVGEAQYRLGLKITDVFICESQPLAILHRAETPTSIGLHPATRSYADLSSYDRVFDVASTVEAAAGLRDGRWDAALTARRFADSDLKLVKAIGPPRDAWLVLSRTEKMPVRTLSG